MMYTRGCSGKREMGIAVHRLQLEAIPHGMGAPTCAGLEVAPAACADWHGTACIPMPNDRDEPQQVQEAVLHL